MTLKRDLLWTFLIQGVGSLSVLLTSIVIARWYGADAFGWFSSAKSLVLFMMAVGCWGLSQGVLDALNQGEIPPKIMATFIAYYGVAFAFVLLLLNASGVLSHWLADRFSSLELLLMCVSGSLFVFHTLYRLMLLSSDKMIAYNVVTMLPNALILLLVVGVLMLDDARFEYAHFVLMFCVALTISVSIAVWRVVRVVGVHQTLRDVHMSAYKKLCLSSAVCAVPPMVQMLIPAVSFHVLNMNSGTTVEAAYLGVGFVLLSIVLTLFNMGSPIVFNQWSKQGDEQVFKSEYASLSNISSCMGALVLVLAYSLVPLVLSVLYGDAMHGAATVCVVLLASSIIWMHAKILMTACLSKAHHGHLACAFALKAVVFLSLVMHQNTAYDVALVWIWVECLFMLHLMCVLVQKQYVSILNLFGRA